MTDKQEHWVSRIRSDRAYKSVHGDDQPPPGSGRERMDWTVLAGAALIIIIVVAGIVVSIRSVDSASGWMDLARLRVTSDEAYLYVLLETSGTGKPDWDRVHYRMAIDTYDRARGARELPSPYVARPGSGIEFMIDLGGPDHSELLVVEGYDPFDGENPVYSAREGALDFRSLEVKTNRERFSRDGRHFPSVTIDRGTLRYGSLDPESADLDTRTDVALGDGMIEIRIPWALVNVTDPSSRTVIHSLERGRQSLGTVRTEGFLIYAYSFDLTDQDPELADRLPSRSGAAPLYRWETWERPGHQMIPKQGIGLVRDAMRSIPSQPSRIAEETSP